MQVITEYGQEIKVVIKSTSGNVINIEPVWVGIYDDRDEYIESLEFSQIIKKESVNILFRKSDNFSVVVDTIAK